MPNPSPPLSGFHQAAAFVLLSALPVAVGCGGEPGPTGGGDPPDALSARLSTPEPEMLNILLDDVCPPYEQEDLKQPAKIYPVDGVLKTQLIVGMKRRCVPVFEDNRWTLEPRTLRTYGFPLDHADPFTEEEVRASLDDPNMVWSAPGPTFVLDKASTPYANDGTRFQMKLYNALDPQADPHACNELERLPNAQGERAQGPFFPTSAPNCFHGDNTTNFHFHGFHASPQPGQDFVGLELHPYETARVEHATHGSRGVSAYGEFDFDVAALRHTQAEGTHWYHAHKHGSTALQVLNGLVGTFEIRGEFDRELSAFYDDKLEQRLLVVQQLQEAPPGMRGKPPASAEPLVNGQANPRIRMKRGEVQRWRLVGATMQASAQLNVGFSGDGSPEVMQVAMDGVQFAPENYACQPILRGADCGAGTEDVSLEELNNFQLGPGNRIDLLVKAPDVAGKHTMGYEQTASLHETILEEVQAEAAALVLLTKAKISAQATKPPLITVEVVDEEWDPYLSRFPSEAEFPEMPAYLADIGGELEAKRLDYQMKNQGVLGNDADKNPPEPGGKKGVYFAISGKQYDPACVNETVTLGRPEEWTLTNNSRIAHPFHIHTNPFQLVSEVVWDVRTRREVEYPKPIWMDTWPIPIAACGAVDPKDPTQCESGSGVDTEKKGEAVIRYLAREFTGEFVNHCHILGHEDRGMMHNVQTVCENGMWGQPTFDLSEECREGNYVEAAPRCSS